MKKQAISNCSLLVLLLTAWPADNSVAKEPLAGGWSPVAVTNMNVVAAADFAVKAEEKAMQDRTDERSASLELMAIQAAQQQVVAGINYRLTLTVKRNGKKKTAEAVVWWQGWRKPDPYQLTSWDWK